MVYSNPDNITSFYSTLYYVNDATGQMLFPLILLAIFLVAFIASKNYDTPRAMMFASFISMIAGMGFAFLGLISLQILVLTIIASIFSFLYSWKNS